MITPCPICGFKPLTRQPLSTKSDGLPKTYNLLDGALYSCHQCYTTHAAYFYLFFPNKSIWRLTSREVNGKWYKLWIRVLKKNMWKPPKPKPIMF